MPHRQGAVLHLADVAVPAASQRLRWRRADPRVHGQRRVARAEDRDDAHRVRCARRPAVALHRGGVRGRRRLRRGREGRKGRRAARAAGHHRP
eukprot:5357740-Prymnesium_polylepis.1